MLRSKFLILSKKILKITSYHGKTSADYRAKNIPGGQNGFKTAYLSEENINFVIHVHLVNGRQAMDIKIYCNIQLLVNFGLL